MPPESRYQTALRNSLSKDDLKSLTADHDPERECWSRLELLTAGSLDQLQLLLIAVISGLGGEAPEFRPTYRPGVPLPEGPRPETPEERDERRAMMLARFDGTKKPPPQGA